MIQEGNLANFRKSYEKELYLTISSISALFIFFKNGLRRQEDKHIIEPNAMTLSTISSENCPKSRIVLLKKFDWMDLFFTNYNSTKGKSIQNNNNVCLNFYWPSLEKQIIVIGNANRIPQKDSDDYFNSRPHGSQIGAIVSKQSEVIDSREFLERKFIELNDYYTKIKPKRPKNWGGIFSKTQLI